MTERYTHLIPDQKRQAAEGIKRLFNSISNHKPLQNLSEEIKNLGGND
jgi:hypothetical protein